jgi:hypothetical protein
MAAINQSIDILALLAKQCNVEKTRVVRHESWELAGFFSKPQPGLVVAAVIRVATVIVLTTPVIVRMRVWPTGWMAKPSPRASHHLPGSARWSGRSRPFAAIGSWSNSSSRSTRRSAAPVRSRTAEAIHAEVAREVTMLLGRMFAERKLSGGMNLEAVEMGLCAALHQAGAATLTELLQFPELAAGQRTVACSCGSQAHHRERRSRRLLTAPGEVELVRPWLLCLHCHHGQFPAERQFEGQERIHKRQEIERRVCKARQHDATTAVQDPRPAGHRPVGS